MSFGQYGMTLAIAPPGLSTTPNVTSGLGVFRACGLE